MLTGLANLCCLLHDLDWNWGWLCESTADVQSAVFIACNRDHSLLAAHAANQDALKQACCAFLNKGLMWMQLTDVDLAANSTEAESASQNLLARAILYEGQQLWYPATGGFSGKQAADNGLWQPPLLCKAVLLTGSWTHYVARSTLMIGLISLMHLIAMSCPA